jgi:alpha-mannosidase
VRIVILALVTSLWVGSAALAGEEAASTGGDTVGRLGVVATAHLDTQWRWTIRNTIDSFVPDTFRKNFALMDQYPEYVFSFEGAFKYMLLREYYPEEFAKLQKYIDRGQWRLCGSWVDPVDVNMPSFESLVRQVLYGNGYTKKEFGVTSQDVFLPDCFGFGYALPSIAAHCGLKSFSSQKLSWGSAFGVPFDIGVWEGVDGSTLVSALRPHSYSAPIRTDLSRDTVWTNAVARQKKASGLPLAYMYFGTGDTGGSPDSQSVDMLVKSMHSDGPLKVSSIGADDLVKLVGENNLDKLPRFKGELVMTRHGVGCYTSQAAMKRWNRMNELLADATERASVMADALGGLPYPKDALRETWIRFLWHQFHDDLTGTSIPEAYEFSWNDEILCQNRFAGMLTAAVGATSAALDTRVEGVPLVVYNPLAIDRQEVVEATVVFVNGAPKEIRVYDPEGKETPAQVVERYADSLAILFLARVPSVGFAVYDVRSAKEASQLPSIAIASGINLRNDRYSVTVNDNGDVASIHDNKAGRELLSQPIVWELFKDKPQRWPAWEIQYEDLQVPPQVLTDPKAVIRVVENGPVRATIEVTRHWGQSTFVTRISLETGARRVEFHNDVDWREKETLLKVAVRPTTPGESVTYDLGLGVIQRGINRPELYEVPGHQWADLSTRDNLYGVALLNDGRYGWDHPDSNTLRLTLIHTPGVFDDWSWVGDQASQDIGNHTFSFAVLGHRGGWCDGGVAWQGAEFNQPMRAFQTVPNKGELGNIFSLIRVEGRKSEGPPEPPQVMITAVKKAENSDEVVVRMREMIGLKADNVRITVGMPIISVRELDGAENFKGDAQFENYTLVTSLTPYQPKTFALKLAPPSAKVAARVWQAVPLAYDLDGVSLDSDRRDGNIDRSGNTLVGELLPDTIMNNGIGFVTGPTTAGAVNMMVCRGQKIPITPEGGWGKIQLLVTAVGGPAVGVFMVGGFPDTVAVQDYATPIGQWNNRMLSGMVQDMPERIAPAYILREPVGWVGTHRHTPQGINESYKFTYLYVVELAISKGARDFELPKNDRIIVAAATLIKSGYDNVRPARPLYDVAENSLVTASAERMAFVDSMAVHLATPTPGATIHYTLDGSSPTPASAVYTQPVVLKETTQLKARAVSNTVNDAYVTDIAFTRLVPHPAETVGNLTPGLNCKYYEGEWSELPEFDKLTPVKTQVVTDVALQGFARPEDYGLVMTGYVQVPNDGLYDFFISSDDGSALLIGDSLVIDNDGIHGDGELMGSIALKAGKHPIRINMFQRKGGEYLQLLVSGPGVEKKVVPMEWYTH